jgi:hypothetical protein
MASIVGTTGAGADQTAVGSAGAAAQVVGEVTVAADSVIVGSAGDVE